MYTKKVGLAFSFYFLAVRCEELWESFPLWHQVSRVFFRWNQGIGASHMPNSIKLDGKLNIFILVHSTGGNVKQLKSQGVNETGLITGR